jgi:hypothetical protein
MKKYIALVVEIYNVVEDVVTASVGKDEQGVYGSDIF